MRDDARAWFWGRSEIEGPFSFVAVCRHLGVDPDALRDRADELRHGITPTRRGHLAARELRNGRPDRHAWTAAGTTGPDAPPSARPVVPLSALLVA